MNLKRKITAAAVAGLLAVTGCISGAAYEFPHSFWSMNDAYQSAMNSGDDYGIITFGLQAVDLMRTQPQTTETVGVLSSRLYEVANAYERVGDYENAAVYFEQYIPYGQMRNEEDGVKIARAKTEIFPSALDLYTLTDGSVLYYGAKNEPAGGVYFGQVNEHTKPNDSMTLIYQEYGDWSTLDWLNRALSDAQAAGKVIELALNFPGEGSQIDSIISDSEFLSRFCSILAGNTRTPVFLRIGAEVDVWMDRAEADKFISAFRKIASAARNAANNTAIVWCVAHTSPNDVNIDDYYPGDEYVDWVGIAAYANKYFQGREWAQNEKFNEIYFKAGDGADPVRMVENVVQRYGDRKPIMIAEGGASRYTAGEVYADSTDWARLHILRMFSAIPMEYPQVKLMAYFNKFMPDEVQYYDFEDNYEMKQAFEAVTSMPWFIQSGQNSAGSFKKSDGTLYADRDSIEMYAMPYVFKDEQPRVDYFIDGVWSGAAVYLPYRSELDLSAVSEGTHELTAVVTSDGAEKLRRTYSLIKAGASAPTEISGGTDGGNPGGTGVFNDVGILGDSQRKVVSFAAEKGIVNGYEDGSFRPAASITRAEFAAMICRAFGYSAEVSAPFSDTVGHWADEYIKACADKGAVNGVGGGLFAPDDTVTFEQAAKILSVCAGFAAGNEQYPDGFIAAGDANGMFDYVINRAVGSELSRADAAAMFFGAMN